MTAAAYANPVAWAWEQAEPTDILPDTNRESDKTRAAYREAARALAECQTPGTDEHKRLLEEHWAAWLAHEAALERRWGPRHSGYSTAARDCDTYMLESDRAHSDWVER